MGYYLRKLKKAIPLVRFYLSQFFSLIRQVKWAAAHNYLWTILVSKEDGAGFLNPLQLKSEKFVPYPERIELEPTTKCNFKCLKCESTYWDISPQDMSLENFKKVIDQFPHLKCISLSGIGHNWLNRDYMAMLRYLKSKSIFTQFFDTFFFIDEQKAKELIEIQVDKIWVSIDGASKETYEKLQAGSNFERVLQNVGRMMALKKEKKSRFPEVGFHFIVTEDNYREMPDFIRMVHSLNPDPAVLNLVQFTKLIPFRENAYLTPHVAPEVFEETARLAKEFGNFRIDTFRMGSGEKKDICECLDWTVPFITVDGAVYPCCAFTEGNMRQIMHRYAFGNVFEDDFKNIWHSSKFKEFRKMIHENKVPRECKIRNCPAYKID